MSLFAIIFILLVVYQLKHFLADYIFQGEYMLGKFKPGWVFLRPLLAHVGVHAGMTFIIAVIAFQRLDPGMVVRAGVSYALCVAFFDAFVHFFMDRLKASPRYMGRWKPVTAAEYIDAKSIIGQTSDGWHRLHPSVITEARKQLRGNRNFWWALGLDQAVHHLTHYVCIYFILKLAGVL